MPQESSSMATPRNCANPEMRSSARKKPTEIRMRSSSRKRKGVLLPVITGPHWHASAIKSFQASYVAFRTNTIQGIGAPASAITLDRLYRHVIMIPVWGSICMMKDMPEVGVGVLRSSLLTAVRLALPCRIAAIPRNGPGYLGPRYC
jgi:hypothetical protein